MQVVLVYLDNVKITRTPRYNFITTQKLPKKILKSVLLSNQTHVRKKLKVYFEEGWRYSKGP